MNLRCLLTVKHLQLLNSVDILIKTTLPRYYAIISKAGFALRLSVRMQSAITDDYRDM